MTTLIADEQEIRNLRAACDAALGNINNSKEIAK